jgi:hypothetical protein
MIPLSLVKNSFDKCKSLFQSEIKSHNFDINLILIGENSLFDSLDYLTFIMQIEEDSKKEININLDLLSIENLPMGDITIKKLFEHKKIEIIYDKKS